MLSQGEPHHPRAPAGSQTAVSPTPEGCEHSPGRAGTSPAAALAHLATAWQEGKDPRVQRDAGKRLEGQLTLPCPAGRRRRGLSTCIHTVTTLWASSSGCTSVHAQGKEKKHLPWEGSGLHQESSTSDREKRQTGRGKKSPVGGLSLLQSTKAWSDLDN